MPGQHNNRKRSFRNPAVPISTHLTEAQRIEILTLYNRAEWSPVKIAKTFQIALSTVRITIKRGTPTTAKPVGRQDSLTAEQRRSLVHRATLDVAHRRLTHEQVAQLEGISACRRTLAKAFKKEQYHQVIATEEPCEEEPCEEEPCEEEPGEEEPCEEESCEEEPCEEPSHTE
jgi:hypothetical protein